MPNTVFFNAIRMAWNYFNSTTSDQGGFSSSSTTLRNADVVWLENWVPTVYLGTVAKVEMTFAHAEVQDIRARARTLQQLDKWEDEGAVVERWVETALVQRKMEVPHG